MTRDDRSTRLDAPMRWLGLVAPSGLISLSICLAAGCSQFHNPFRDELAGQPPVSTPAVQGIHASSTNPRTATRDYATVSVAPHDGTVLHGPLLFEDPHDEGGNDDGRFAWTAEDYHHFFYWRGRFLVNLAALPVSEVVTPPWTVMASDGKLQTDWRGEHRDAEVVTAAVDSSDQVDESTE